MADERERAVRCIQACDQLLQAMNEGRDDAYRMAKRMIEDMLEHPHQVKMLVRATLELAVKESKEDDHEHEMD